MISVSKDSGSATVEFIGLTALLLIPVLYLMITISQLQAAGYAAVAAADQAAKVVAYSQNSQVFERLAHETVHLTVENFYLDPETTTTTIECSDTDCSAPGTRIAVQVEIDVALPLIPSIFGNQTRIATLQASGYHLIGEFE